MARNRGIDTATCEICFPIDDDVILVNHTTVENTLGEFANPRFWAATIPFFNVNRNHEPKQFLNENQLSSGDVFTTYAFIGCAHAVRRSIFKALGGYREEMFYMGEESDICIRALDRGYLVKMGAAEPCHHLESPARVSSLAAYYGRRNDIRMAFWYSPLRLMPRFVFFRIAAATYTSLFRSAEGAMCHHLAGTLCGVWDCLAGWSSRRPVNQNTFLQFWRLRSCQVVRVSDLVVQFG
jgi:GT2 family glycosyltransferase